MPKLKKNFRKNTKIILEIIKLITLHEIIKFDVHAWGDFCVNCVTLEFNTFFDPFLMNFWPPSKNNKSHTPFNFFMNYEVCVDIAAGF